MLIALAIDARWPVTTISLIACLSGVDSLVPAGVAVSPFAAGAAADAVSVWLLVTAGSMADCANAGVDKLASVSTAADTLAHKVTLRRERIFAAGIAKPAFISVPPPQSRVCAIRPDSPAYYMVAVSFGLVAH
ncbi:hypothetical protein [Sphingomonas abietis]|uniref:Uncharacterized protein n=1 Tax=Sphingomonas abietis TaxID=3012344 RepID=A0ABY7NPY2_9SPHN|nr:hypothetical protein [Sphingomonas abietis]WBO21546.1 hypothetical protein PBT88_15360 [Sphingomonas abietis]